MNDKIQVGNERWRTVAEEDEESLVLLLREGIGADVVSSQRQDFLLVQDPLLAAKSINVPFPDCHRLDSTQIVAF